MKRRNGMFAVGIIICVALMCFSGYRIYQTLAAYRAGDAVNKEVQQYVQLEPETQQENTNPSEPQNGELTQTEPLPDADPVIYPEVDFDSLLAINEDVVGWIYIEDTAINYPIVQGEDNREYVSTSVDGKYNQYGSIFMDYRNTSDFSDRHTVIYGHYMKNGAMFRDIRKYDDPQFYEAHPTGMIMTPEENFQFEVIGGYVASTADASWQLSFAGEEDFGAWLQDSMDRSTIGGTVVPSVNDRILTLSTCSYEFSNARFVLVCRIIDNINR